MGKKSLKQATKADIIFVLFKNSCLSQKDFMDEFNARRAAINHRRNKERSRTDASRYKVEFKSLPRDLKRWIDGYKMLPYNLDREMASALLNQQAYGDTLSVLKTTIELLEQRGFDMSAYRDLLTSEDTLPEDVYCDIVEALSVYAFLDNCDPSTEYSDHNSKQTQKTKSPVPSQNNTSSIDLADDFAEDIQIKTVSDLGNFGLSPLDIATQLVKNDRTLYPVADENEGTESQWATFIRSMPEAWRFLFNTKTKEIVGNWSFCVLSEIDSVIKGELLEETLSLENTVHLATRGFHEALYILNFSVNEDFRLNKYRLMLFDALLKQIELLARQGIFFKKVIVNAFISDHIGLYKSWGFRVENKNKVSGTILSLDLTELPKKFLNKELEALYKEALQQE